MAENNEPTAADSADKLPELHTPQPRRHVSASSRPAASQSELGDQLADLADTFRVLSGQLASPEKGSSSQESPRERKVKKFQRSGVNDEQLPPVEAPLSLPVPVERPAPVAGGESDAAMLNRNIAWPHLVKAAPDSIPAAKPRPKRKRKGVLPYVVLQVFGIGLLMFGYWLGQGSSAATGGPAEADGSSAAGRKPGGPRPVPHLTERAFQAANTAVRAEKAGDADGARKLYEAAISQELGLMGAHYRLGLLAWRREDLIDADLNFDRATNIGENVAECCYIRARFAGQKGDYAEVSRQFQLAAHAEPFNGKIFFYWGEALRRQGKPQAALNCLQQALDRPYTAPEGELYLFKLRLAKSEAGHDAEFDAQLAQQLEQPSTAGEWLLIAAAKDLDLRAYPAAADHLKKAAAALPADIYASRVQDYVFQMHAKQPEVAALINLPAPSAASAAGPTTYDPASFTSQEGDPATWPEPGGPFPTPGAMP